MCTMVAGTVCTAIGLVPLLLPLILVHIATALDNGLARTPPMGWMAWQRFRCEKNCARDTHGRVNCVSEELFKSVADAMVSEGFAAAGYQYVSVDACWAESERDEHGHVVANRVRFPSGMRALADYIHSKGLKFGLCAVPPSYACPRVVCTAQLPLPLLLLTMRRRRRRRRRRCRRCCCCCCCCCCDL